MGINITGDVRASETVASDLAGRFRAGYVANGAPASLKAFRVTTGDANVAKTIVDLFGDDKGTGPSEWDATGEDYLEVFTSAAAIDIIIPDKDSYKSQLVKRTVDGDFIYSTDGEVITAVGGEYEDEYSVGDRDPQEGQDLATRKAKAKKGLGSNPDIRITFYLAGHEDLGLFQYRTGGWSLVSDSPEAKINRLGDGAIKAQLKLTEVETAKFTFTKPELLIRGLVDGPAVKAKAPVTDLPW